MHISFSVDTDTLTPEQLRGLSMLLTGITAPSPYQVEPTPGEPEFEFKTAQVIKRSNVSLKVGDAVVITGWPDEGVRYIASDDLCDMPGGYESRHPLRIESCGYWTRNGFCNVGGKVTEVNGLKIIEDAP